MTENRLQIKDELTDFLLYTTPYAKAKVEISLHNKNIWLAQKRMAEFFGINIPAISKHLDNINANSELNRNSTVPILGPVETESSKTVKRNEEYYNFNIIISVGYKKIVSDFDTQIKKLKG